MWSLARIGPFGVARPRPARSLSTRSLSTRHYSSARPYAVFDRRVKQLQRDRAAADVETSRQADYLRDEAAARLTERLLDINRSFKTVLDIGANSCNVAAALAAPSSESDRSPIGSRIGKLVAIDPCQSMLFRDADEPKLSNLPFKLERRVIADADAEDLPFPNDSFDAVVSSMSLHWINDLPGMLGHVNRVLKPDSPFLAVIIGGNSLFELRTSLQLASQERLGGVGVHVSPLADVRDVGGLLTRAGFKILTVDVDDLVVDYPSMYHLIQDLQAMGDQNCVIGRSGPLHRDVLAAADGIYRALHGNDDGSVPATFRLIYMIGWKDGPDTPTPLARGSGMVSIKDMLEQGLDGEKRQ